MKLFLREDIRQGQVLAENVIFTYGNKILPVAFRKTPLIQGYYFKIELPFQFKRKYFHCGTFEFRIGKCRPVFFFSARKWECVDKYTYDYILTWQKVPTPE